ncbi:MAG: hypothetical protein CMO81_02535 [Waddliaceae bacterium]|nr:hypothetical protein [Waddliaceae bacterium]
MLGELFALLSALSNSTIGVLTYLSQNSLASHHLAFYKCFFAFIAAFLYLFFKGRVHEITDLKPFFPKIAQLSFLGVFLLSFTQIWAFQLISIPNVSFLFYAGTSFAVLGGIIFLGESTRYLKILGSLFTLSGGGLIYSAEISHLTVGSLGSALALLSGLSCACFLLLQKHYQIPINLSFLCVFLGFGSLYLSVPFFMWGVAFPTLLDLPILLVLSLFPTLYGFFCTIKALSLTDAGKVQIFEMADPIFASFFAYMIFNEQMTAQEYLGATTVCLGLFISAWDSQRHSLCTAEAR